MKKKFTLSVLKILIPNLCRTKYFLGQDSFQMICLMETNSRLNTIRLFNTTKICLRIKLILSKCSTCLVMKDV